MLVMADRNFYSFEFWTECLKTVTDLLWRVNANVELPVLTPLTEGSYLSLVMNPALRGNRRDRLIAAARAGQDIDPDDGIILRVVEYDIPDRQGNGTGELICLTDSAINGARRQTSTPQLVAGQKAIPPSCNPSRISHHQPTSDSLKLVVLVLEGPALAKLDDHDNRPAALIDA